MSLSRSYGYFWQSLVSVTRWRCSASPVIGRVFHAIGCTVTCLLSFADHFLRTDWRVPLANCSFLRAQLRSFRSTLCCFVHAPLCYFRLHSALKRALEPDRGIGLDQDIKFSANPTQPTNDVSSCRPRRATCKNTGGSHTGQRTWQQKKTPLDHNHVEAHNSTHSTDRRSQPWACAAHDAKSVEV